MGAAMTRSPLGAPPHGPAHRGQSPGEQFFTVAAVAALLDVSVRTVRRWIKRGDLAPSLLTSADEVIGTDCRTRLVPMSASGTYRTSAIAVQMSAFDPKRTYLIG